MNNQLTIPGCEAADVDPCATDFSAALMWMKQGLRVMRAGWNGKSQFVCKATIGNLSYEQGDDSEMTFVDTLVLRNSKNMIATWVPSIGDLMAEDWEVYQEQKATTLSDHQQLALEELEQLNERLATLTAFINDPGSTFPLLSQEEQHQMRMRAAYAEDYARALKRIAAGLAGEGVTA